jgi:hypothetical protein
MPCWDSHNHIISQYKQGRLSGYLDPSTGQHDDKATTQTELYGGTVSAADSSLSSRKLASPSERL